MFKFWGDINSQSPKSQPCDGDGRGGYSVCVFVVT